MLFVPKRFFFSDSAPSVKASDVLNKLQATLHLPDVYNIGETRNRIAATKSFKVVRCMLRDNWHRGNCQIEGNDIYIYLTPERRVLITMVCQISFIYFFSG